MKKCLSCGNKKPANVFNKNKARKDGLSAYCRLCANKKQAESYEKHKEKRIAGAASWYQENKEKAIESKKRWKQNNKQKTALYQLKHLYGLSEESYQKLLKKQKNCCGICGVSEKTLEAKLDVDHDHKTGVVRGLLCNKCNTALGRLGDSVQSIKKVLKYLSQTKKRV